ncbi:MAG: 3-oxoacyl-[acyl-carrier-protein] reductase [Planctomycetota bacterium]|jgi:3-oxoacyl-(acyl-carrier-protein) reductase
MELKGKVSLVSGSSRGIGRSIAIMLAEAGSDIAVNYVSNADAAAEVVKEVEKLGRKAIAYHADVSHPEDCKAMVEKAESDFGTVQILVNNAGITRDRSFLKLSVDQWQEVLMVNLNGPFNLTGHLLPSMIESGWGRIINISSIVAQMGNFGQSNYAVAKGGLIAFTKTLAREVARKSVTVNAVAPGFIETDMTSAVPDEALDIVRKLTPIGRLGKPEEVALAVRYLASPRASYVTGQVLNVNGGMYM